jgi:outer membrane protein TolC
MRDRTLASACPTISFGAGADNLFTVLDAERILAATDAVLAQSDALVTTYQIALFKALEGGWEQS